jgi:hypothetical protein
VPSTTCRTEFLAAERHGRVRGSVDVAAKWKRVDNSQDFDAWGQRARNPEFL